MILHQHVDVTCYLTSARCVLVLPALQDASGRYVINGDWKISYTGNYSAGGVQFVYDRDGTSETLRAAGPLTENVTLVVRRLVTYVS